MRLDGLLVREAQLEDYNDLIALEQKVIDAERPFNVSLKDHSAHYYDIEELISGQSNRLLLGEILGVVIATGYLQIRESKPSLTHNSHGYLGFMYVAEDYRGLGLNKIILKNLVHWGQSQGVADFYLDVYAENSSAVRAYQKFGFEGSLLEMKFTARSN